MIHLKSTLAISAIMLTGLVAASPFPYAGDQEPRQPRRTVSAQIAPAAEAAAAPVAVTAWADPPAKSQAVADEPAIVVNAAMGMPAIDDAVAPVVAAAPVRHVAAQAKAEQPRRRKMARAAARQRQAAVKQTLPEAPAETQVATRAAPTAAQKIDPIGDILRGLGIGKEG